VALLMSTPAVGPIVALTYALGRDSIQPTTLPFVMPALVAGMTPFIIQLSSK
jgi:hypothetical protein